MKYSKSYYDKKDYESIWDNDIFNQLEKCKSISRLKLIYTIMITHPEEN